MTTVTPTTSTMTSLSRRDLIVLVDLARSGDPEVCDNIVSTLRLRIAETEDVRESQMIRLAMEKIGTGEAKITI